MGGGVVKASYLVIFKSLFAYSSHIKFDLSLPLYLLLVDLLSYYEWVPPEAFAGYAQAISNDVAQAFVCNFISHQVHCAILPRFLQFEFIVILLS
jgi:hypothetical protein